MSNNTVRRMGIAGLALAISVVTLAAPVDRAQGAVVVNPLKVVLIGDSYAAGNGAYDADGNRNYVGPSGCRRSPTNWASQYVDWLGDEGFSVTFVNRACSGGVIAHYTNRRSMDDKPVVIVAHPDTPPAEIEAAARSDQCRTRFPGDEVYTATYQRYDPAFGHLVLCNRSLEPQINAIGKDTDLVLVTGGGNDVNFGEIVRECFAPILRDPEACRFHVENAKANIAIIENGLVDLFAEIRTKARPDTKVVLVGYPYLVNNDDFELVRHPLSPFFWELDRYAAAREVRELGRLGDARQQAAVDRANAAAGEPFVFFVDEVKTHFIGHEPKPELGTGNPDRWMNE